MRKWPDTMQTCFGACYCKAACASHQDGAAKLAVRRLRSSQSSQRVKHHIPNWRNGIFLDSWCEGRPLGGRWTTKNPHTCTLPPSSKGLKAKNTVQLKQKVSVCSQASPRGKQGCKILTGEFRPWWMLPMKQKRSQFPAPSTIIHGWGGGMGEKWRNSLSPPKAFRLLFRVAWCPWEVCIPAPQFLNFFARSNLPSGSH